MTLVALSRHEFGRKQRRMKLRSDLENRVAEPVNPRPQNRHPKYLIAHACFSCRKSFKLDPGKPRTCPQCGRILYEMGRSFRAPRSTDRDQWRKVQALYAHGFRFFGRGSSDAEPLPRRYRDVAPFVKRNPEHRLRVAPEDLTLMPEDE